MSEARWIVLVGLIVAGCSEVQVATCPTGTLEEQGICRVSCARNAECLASEVCNGSFCAPVVDDGNAQVRIFRASEEFVSAGDEVRLEWVTVNARSVDLQPDVGAVPVSGTRIVRPTQTTTYELRARGAANDDLSAVTVSVVDVPPGDFRIDTFSQSTSPGCEAVQVAWTIVTPPDNDDELKVEIFDLRSNILATSTQRVGVATLDITSPGPVTLVATLGEQSDTRTLDVDTSVICAFFGSPEVGLVEGDTALIEWETRSSGTVRLLDLDDGAVLYETDLDDRGQNGFWLVEPRPPSTRYGLEVVTSDGIFSTDLVIVVEARLKPPVIKQFRANPPTVRAGDTFTLEYDVADAARITITRDGMPVNGPTGGPSGTVTLIGNNTTTLRIEAENEDGTAALSILHQVAVDGSQMSSRQNPDPLVRPVCMGCPPRPVSIDDSIGGIVGTSKWYGLPAPLSSIFRVHLASLDGVGCIDAGLIPELIVHRGNQQVGPSEVRYDTAGCPIFHFLNPAASNHLIEIRPPDGGLFVYRLTVDPSEPQCGDANVEGYEICDAGDIRNGDGCSAQCEIEPDFVYDPPRPVPAVPPLPNAETLDFHPYASSGGDTDDEGFAIVPFAEPFFFYGRRYAGAVVHRDGYITFRPDFERNTLPTQLPSIAEPNPAIYLFGADLTGGDVRFTSHEVGDTATIEYVGARLRGTNTSVDATAVLRPNGGVVLSVRRLEGNQRFNFLSGFEGPFGRFWETANENFCPGARCDPSGFMVPWSNHFPR